MDTVPFQILFPEIADKETRLLAIDGLPEIPADDYNLIESYCCDLDCDCQQVVLNVFSRKDLRLVATILFGFNRDSESAGPFLDPRNPQNACADAMLGVVAAHLLADPAYAIRLKAHYALVKAALADPQHPVQQKLVEWKAEVWQRDLAKEKREATLQKAIRVISEHEPAFIALERKTKKRCHSNAKR